MAVRTLILYDNSLSLAMRTSCSCLHITQNRSLNLNYRTTSATMRASFLFRACFCTASAAALAGNVFLYLDFFLYTFVYFFQGEFYSYSEVASAVYSAARRRTSAAKASESAKTAKASAAKNIAKHRENIVHVHSAAAKACLSIYTCVSELVVTSSLFFVSENIVCLCGFLKLFFGFLVSRIFVRVILYGKLSVRLLQFFICGVL